MKSVRVLFFGVLLGIVSSCSTQKEATVQTVDTNELSEESIFQFKYKFFEAGRAMLHGDLDNALMLYNECLAIDPKSSTSLYKIATIYWFKKDLNTAETYITKALALNNTNVYILEFGGNLYLNNGNADAALRTFDRLIELDEKNINYYLAKADVYIKDNEFSKALKLYDSIEKKFGITELVSLRKHRLFLSQGKEKEAINELIKLSDFYKVVPDYKRLLAEYYVQSNQIDLAIITYNDVLANFPDDGYSFMGLAECYRVKGDYPNAFVYLKNAFLSTDIESDVKVELLSALYQVSGQDLTLQSKIAELLTILMDQYPNDVNVNMLYADFLMRLGSLQEARVVIRKVVNVKKDSYSLWEQLMYLENEFADWNSMYTESKEALKYFPNQSLLYFFNGFSAFQLNKLEESKSSFEFGFRLITQDDPLKKDYLTFLGEVNHKLGYKAKAYEYFDQLLLVDSENIMVMNNYAYYLSLDKENLDKAKKMSFKTIQKDPYSSTYLDTYAWILFCKGEYEEALDYIKKAIIYNSDNSEVIIEHYGDILYQNNDVENALVQWKLALEIGEGSGKIQEKIDAQKYIE